jgi:hypothetical protein
LKKLMNETLQRRRVVCAVLAGVLGLAGAVIAGQQPAAAAGGPIIAGLTPSSTATTAGTPVTLVGSAANTTNATQRVSMGAGFPATVSYAGAVGGNGRHPRHTVNLVYCGLNLPAGATATITFTVVPQAAGASTLRSYARITYTNDDTLAYAAITAS